MKRQKYVFKTEQVAHIWAQQTQDEGRNAQGNFYFTGDTIYSYGSHFPIARFINPQTVLFTSLRYSNTTTKHLYATRDALRGLDVQVIDCENVKWDDYSERLITAAHDKNLKAMRDEHKAQIVKAHRAHLDYSINGYLNAAKSLRENYAAYVKLFALKALTLTLPSESEIAAVIKTQKAESKAHREARAQAEAARIERDKQWAAKRAAEHAENLSKWRMGENVSLYPSFDDPTALRLTNNNTVIQTSRGAEVPASVAPALWQMVKKQRAVGLTLVVGGGAITVGHFPLREVKADGSIIVGCHTLPYTELEGIARTLGYTA